jgi:hypothetical protein
LSAIAVISSATILILRHRRKPASEVTQTTAIVESEDADTAQNEGASIGSNGKAVNNTDTDTGNEIKVDSSEAGTLGIEKG